MHKKKKRLSANDNRGPKRNPLKSILQWALILSAFVALIYYLALPSDWFQFSEAGK